MTLSTIRTLDLLPPDLNTLLVHLEQTLARAHQLNGDTALATEYAGRAQTRVEAIQRVRRPV